MSLSTLPLEGTAGAAPAEGSLLPETYHYARGDTRADLVKRMGRALDETLTYVYYNGKGNYINLGKLLPSLLLKTTLI